MIAIVYPEFYGVQGIARYVDSFLKNLPHGHPKVYVITGDKDDSVDRSYGDSVEIINLEFRKSRFSLFYWSFQARKTLKKLNGEGRIKVVNLHIPPMIPGLFLPRNMHYVLTLHTTYLGMSGKFYPQQYYQSQWGGAEIFFKRMIEKYILSYTDKVITLTEQGKQELSRYNYKGLVDIIPNGADLSRFSPTDENKGYDLIFSGRIETRKGSRPMVDFCESIIQRKDDIKILIVGYGDDDAYVKERLGKYSNNVLITGKVPFGEMLAYYNSSKIYVSTSYYEGLPGTCIEAMSMKLPVVVWDLLFYKNLVKSKRNGFKVEVNNIDAMVTSTLELLSDDTAIKGLGENAREDVSGSYDWEKLSEKVLSSMLEHAENEK